MKFTTVLFASLLAVVPALAAPQAASNTVAGPSTAITHTMSPTETCLNACPLGDVICQARCVGVARPNELQANQTTECAMKCDQGDGSPAATERYSQCVQACITSFFPAGQTAGPLAGGPNAPTAAAATGANSNPTGGASPVQTNGPSGTSPSGTGSSQNLGSASTTSSQGAAPTNMIMGVSVAGIAGLMVAFAAL